MYKVLCILLLSLIISLQLKSQIFPKEGSLLNYRIIGFSFPQLPKASKYKIEIANGNYSRADSFAKNIIQSVESKSNCKIVEVRSFGSQYTWRVVYRSKKENDSTILYHFSTLWNDHIDTNKLHLRILKPAAEQYKDDYVAVDAGGVLYDMNGIPVWFIPDTNGITGNVADLNFTPEGTMTFLYRKPFEINYNGDILWKAPDKGVISGDSAHGENFHHEFVKLSNGNYMVLGMQFLDCKSVTLKDSSYIIVSKGTPGIPPQRKSGRFGTIIEYDEKGNIVWSWKSSGYLIGSDFDYYKGMDSVLRFDAHDNAFFFDEKNHVIYLGYRNLSRIIKIAYPSGKILGTYGENFKPGVAGTGTGILCNQHNISRTQDGYLYIFNNNSCNLIDSLPSVVILEEPHSPTDTFKKVWEYTCTIDGYYPQGYRKIFGSGGNAVELPDRSMFVNMGSEYSKLFIVNRAKNILWSALPERFMETDQKWTAIHEYRGNIISRKDLESLIWNAETWHPKK